jgi:glycosyltransferase involved in cell wall biosynthesis
LRNFYQAFPGMPLVSISEAQRGPIPSANFAGTVLHGLPEQLMPVGSGRGGYLAFLGRISPEKRVDRAIEIARATGLPLKIAAKVDRADEAYFRERIAPLLNSEGIEFVGEIDERGKAAFLGDALALLFPINWPEPFGLVMIEAMARGTPVLAFNCGSVPEVIEPGVTGYIVESVNEAIRAVKPLLALDRARIGQRFKERFTARRMAADYVRLYEAQLAARRRSARALIPVSRPIRLPAVVPGRAEQPMVTASAADQV